MTHSTPGEGQVDHRTNIRVVTTVVIRAPS